VDGISSAALMILPHSAFNRLTASVILVWLRKPNFLNLGSSRVAMVIMLSDSMFQICSLRRLMRFSVSSFVIGMVNL